MKKYSLASILILVAGIATASIGPIKTSDNLLKSLITMNDLKAINLDTVQVKDLPFGMNKVIENGKVYYYLKIFTYRNLSIIYIWNLLPSSGILSYVRTEKMEITKNVSL